jgi:hypothetical protein
VTTGLLPLAAGATLALQVGDKSYMPALSRLASALPTGTCLYAHVDSADASSTYGAVWEIHERTAGPYNNITSYQLGAPVTLGANRTNTAGSTAVISMPPRP